MMIEKFAKGWRYWFTPEARREELRDCQAVAHLMAALDRMAKDDRIAIGRYLDRLVQILHGETPVEDMAFIDDALCLMVCRLWPERHEERRVKLLASKICHVCGGTKKFRPFSEEIPCPTCKGTGPKPFPMVKPPVPVISRLGPAAKLESWGISATRDSQTHEPCPDCHGSGEIRLFTSVKPCPTCRPE